MTNLEIFLSVLTFLFAALTIRAYLKAGTLQKCNFSKALTMLCIIESRVFAAGAEPNHYSLPS